MSITVKQMTEDEVEQMIADNKPSSRLCEKDKKFLEERGWHLNDEHFCMEKEYKEYKLVIEFCIGDFCTYIGSKKSGYLLEKKVPKNTFLEAILQHEAVNIPRIDDGEHWVGEDN